jgi:hypothetical protein
MNSIRLDIYVNNKNYNFVFNNINNDVKLNIDLPQEEDAQLDNTEMRSRIRFLEERLRRTNRTNRQLQNRRVNGVRNQSMQNTQSVQNRTNSTENSSIQQQISEINMLLRILQDINNAYVPLPTSTPPTSTIPTSTPPSSTLPTSTLPTSTPSTSTPPTSTPPTNTIPTSTPPTSTIQQSLNTQIIGNNQDADYSNQINISDIEINNLIDELPLLIDTEEKNQLQHTQQHTPQPTQQTTQQTTHQHTQQPTQQHTQQPTQNIEIKDPNIENNILISDLFNFADFLSNITTNPRRLYKDAGKINRAAIPIEDCIINLQNYSTIVREKPVQLKSYIEIAKAIDELIRNAMSCNVQLISRYGILIDLEYSKYMVKMCKKSSQDIFNKFLELTNFEIPGETAEQADNREKIRLIAINLRDGKLNDILHVLDTPGCHCQFCN